LALISDNSPPSASASAPPTPPDPVNVGPHTPDKCGDLLDDEYYSLAIDELRGQGDPRRGARLHRLGHSESINFLRHHRRRLRGRAGQAEGGRRPLRPTSVNESGTFLFNP
jgi:hypothetical protein